MSYEPPLQGTKRPDLMKAVKYIEEIYSEKKERSLNEFIRMSGVEDFDPLIEDDIARLFSVLVTLTRPKRILEIGTSIGFSTTILAKAMEEWGGRVISLEIDAEVAKNAIANFKREGVKDSIDVVIGNADETIRDFEDDSFDIVFQDSSKRLYPVMLDECLRVLKPGGLLLVDDTLFPVINPKEEWTDSDEAIHRFNKRLLERSVISTILPIGEGCTIAVKL
ncbi:methyltransferase domain-containing protein [Candidatus Thorarchaeota archaeon]|nr:MAG: methyltransferase domain-containing protein [Candidatus Thorarchaeota archaeon]